MELTYNLGVFEGPLDLLLNLISKNKLNIADIPIAFLLEQYLAHIEVMQAFDTEIAEEFIVMAAELMLIKSRMLLPKRENEDAVDPREALAAALIEYGRIKAVAGVLAQQYALFGTRFAKATDEVEGEAVDFSGQSVMDLRESALAMERRARLVQTEIIEAAAGEKLNTIATRKPVSVAQRIISLLRQLVSRGEMQFEEVLMSCANREEAVASFAAILQLCSTQRLTITDDEESHGNPRLILNKTVRTMI
ncbi:MAG: segregation/condensation protein A [Oscillospiraceae bacterium]|nr:segregation/condensation protein A [Oscillospiraceae bacterium]